MFSVKILSGKSTPITSTLGSTGVDLTPETEVAFEHIWTRIKCVLTRYLFQSVVEAVLKLLSDSDSDSDSLYTAFRPQAHTSVHVCI